MTSNELLIQKLGESGKDVFWQGAASTASIDKLESMLGTRLPASFRIFLVKYGGGGVVGEEISGVEDDDPSLENRGTVLGDTIFCQEQFRLPRNMVVIYRGEDDVVWCLDVARFDGDECEVVCFDVFSKTTTYLANSFDEFFSEYLNLRIQR